MADNGRTTNGIYGTSYVPKELPHYVHSQFSGFHKYNQYFYVRVGLIEDVDIDKYQMTVNWEPQSKGMRNRVPISFPYAGPAGCIGGLPERGALGIFGFFNEGDGKGSPLLLNYLPAGLDAGLNFNVVKVLPDALPTSDVNEIQHRFHKLTEGDIIVAAPTGANIFLNRNMELQDNAQDSILIREDDQVIIATALNNFIFANGASVSAGPAIRNNMRLYDDQGNRLENNGSSMPLSDGKDQIYIVPFGKEISYDTNFYTEYRIEVDEQGDGKIDLNDINSSSPLSTRDPIVIQALGNYIGSDRTNPQKYGAILKARLFSSGNDQKGAFSLEKCLQNNTLDEPSITGLVYALHFRKSNSFIGVDKEGHYYMNLQASKANPLGAGRSMSILAQGNLKEIWGSETEDSNSWDLTTTGGIRWNIGNHDPDLKSRSIQIKTSKGISIDVGDVDDDGYAKTESLKGNVSQSILGDKEQTCSNLTYQINGLKKENITGSATETVQSDKTINVLGVSTENVTKEKQCKFGKRKTTITTGNDELEVIRGNIDESITTFGKKKTTILSGGIEETITTGSHKMDIKAGSYKLGITGGNIEMKTTAGTAKYAATSVSTEATALANVKSPMVKLGKGALIGGVVSGLPGKPNHNDYMSGAPLKGSMKVSVG